MKVLVGLSGGVDSAVAASILLEAGYEVGGAYMRMCQGAGKMSDSTDARKVADLLQIPFYELDVQDVFRKEVLDYFTQSYRAGLTPNPCVRCNEKLKFGAFLKAAEEFGYDAIATGHYARITRGEDGLYRLQKADNREKDQSYFLYHLTQEQLGKSIFPLASLDKEQIREKARAIGIHVAEKKDSQDICFVEQGKYIEFIEAYTGETPIPGEFVDTEGNFLGRHKGIERYTIGQRKGVEVAFGKPMYVVSKDAESRRVVMGDHADLMTTTLHAERVRIHPAYEALIREGNYACLGRHRYGQKEIPVRVSLDGDRLHIQFETPQRAVTPGQILVLFDGDTVIGGGEIC
ncbi:MAG: tRNA 2-thiouridine(34) synthase MnmA [Clostridia bacterium]|nr:tRNA 2-thiouridine(34) synthase MnmA [Clostridia bacterium]